MTPDELEALTRRPGPGRIDAHSRAWMTTETLVDLPHCAIGCCSSASTPPVSVEAGHYHQAGSATFWRRLILAGILPPATPIEIADDALMAVGHGITDLLKEPTPRDVATDAELTAGVGPLWQKIAIWRPAAVVFVYKRAASICAGRSLSESWGQLAGVALAGRPCFLMPDPMGPSRSRRGLNFLRNLAAALPVDRA
jgi:hypothetical protein